MKKETYIKNHHSATQILNPKLQIPTKKVAIPFAWHPLGSGLCGKPNAPGPRVGFEGPEINSKNIALAIIIIIIRNTSNDTSHSSHSNTSTIKAYVKKATVPNQSLNMS